MSKEDFYNLTPDLILNAVDNAGFRTTGQLLQLNSYENRVFEVEIEGSYQKNLEKNKISPLSFEKIIAKFYRPGRWDEKTIYEEHEFLFDLLKNDLPVLCPLLLKEKKSLLPVTAPPKEFSAEKSHPLLMALFTKSQGRMVQEFDEDDLFKIGQTIAQMHNVGATKKFKYRPRLDVKTYGWSALHAVENFIRPEVNERYKKAAEIILENLEILLDSVSPIRVHGDLHRGNILEKDTPGEPKSYYFVDFDDCMTGPAVQDFWMLLSGDQKSQESELHALIKGYEEWRLFDERELDLLNSLRGLRIIYYAGWIARRWSDPSFPHIFPQFTEYNYWARETEALEALAY